MVENDTDDAEQPDAKKPKLDEQEVILLSSYIRQELVMFTCHQQRLSDDRQISA